MAPKITIENSRTVELKYDSDNRFPFKVETGHQKGKEWVRLFVGTTSTTYWRDEFLEAVVSLWPENVAYQFPIDEDDDIEFEEEDADQVN